MSTRIDDLEKNIADLMTQAGVEEIEAAPEKQKESQSTSSWRWDRSLSGRPPQQNKMNVLKDRERLDVRLLQIPSCFSSSYFFPAIGNKVRSQPPSPGATDFLLHDFYWFGPS